MTLDGSEPIDAARHGRTAWWAVAAAWGLVQVAMCVAGLFWGGVAGASVTWTLLPHWLGIRPTVAGLPVGFLLGLAAALAISHYARTWVQRARLRLLRRRGTTVTAQVAQLHRTYRYTARGGGSTSYRMDLHWTDPDGTLYRLARHYRFYGRGPSGFEQACGTGAAVTLAYPPGRPGRAVVDVRYAPAMADLLL